MSLSRRAKTPCSMSLSEYMASMSTYFMYNILVIVFYGHIKRIHMHKFSCIYIYIYILGLCKS